MGLDVWVENNDLLILIGRPACRNEKGMQVKLGLVRLHIDQPFFATDLRRKLRLHESESVVSGSDPSGKAGKRESRQNSPTTRAIRMKSVVNPGSFTPRQ